MASMFLSPAYTIVNLVCAIFTILNQRKNVGDSTGIFVSAFHQQQHQHRNTVKINNFWLCDPTFSTTLLISKQQHSISIKLLYYYGKSSSEATANKNIQSATSETEE
jgi:hypothetical protein